MTYDDPTEDYVRWCELHRDDFNDSLPVSEVFGPTIQGEGPHTGRPCWFIRTGGCNLSCTWCDTKYSTGTHGIPLSTIPRRTVRSVVDAIPRGEMVVLTGGEPLMHLKRPPFVAMLHGLRAKGCEVHVETNGTILPTTETSHLFDHFTVSPKLGVAMARKRDTPKLPDWADYAHMTVFKWVMDNLDTRDAEQAARDALTTSLAHGIPKHRVWVMPEGELPEQLAEHWADVAQAAANVGINASHRLHALAWGNAKGH